MLDINLNLYKTFYEVAKTKSLTEASNNLYITTPAVSKNIKKLEEQLNENLFYRENNGVSLTNSGEELYTYVEKVIKIIDDVERIIVNNEDLNTVILKIGSPSHVSNYYLMECIKKAKEDYPNMKLLLKGRSKWKRINKNARRK